ncbi:MAG: FGGY-family carbohydrate kinase [Myxococcales bacterium]|nr:FGGY-family carbohydrate kinase [Myxococcales bacterium]HQY59885.1 FGGY-family carbohydrate kinase [Polyangiaceae bacterium]
MTSLTLGVDVGTGSARAGLFDASGALRGLGVCPIAMGTPEEDFAEQSSEDIWRACGVAVRAALASAGATADDVAGVGFDATCSLVVLDADDAPVTVSPTGDDAWNVIVWMDHRAIDQTRRVNDAARAGGHEVLRYVGGAISVEMQTPKLLWLKERLPASFQRARRFLDLPDFLTFRATGDDTRSLCSTACKWTYLARSAPRDARDAVTESGWQAPFFRDVGLGELADEGFSRLGQRVAPMGQRVGGLTERAARELGLRAGTPVGASIIDAHAGGLGLLGMTIDGQAPTAETLDRRLALIGGTSTCHMAVSREPRFIPGIWGPYFSAMVPDLWLTEGGQSATGALLDHTLATHALGAELSRDAAARGLRATDLLHERLDALAAGAPFAAALTRDLHVLPDHHGNRSPRADASLRGMVSGLKLTGSIDALALLYLATVQALAHGTRHIVDTMNAHGYRIDTLLATGGDAKNAVFLREHADATGCRIVLPREPEAVLLGAAMLGATAAGHHPGVLAAMNAMSSAARVIEPARGPVAAFHDAKHRVFLRMHDDQVAYRALMASGDSTS